MSLTLKITSLFVRTLAKPLANQIKRNAHEHERFRKLCVRFAQGLHRIDMRMRLGLLQDPAVIDRQIAKEVAAAEAARKKSQIPTVKTEAQAKAEEAMTQQEREAARKKIEAASKPRIRPLSEAKAIETGANFVAETFIFAVGISVIVFEQWRQRRKARNQRDDIREDLEELQVELKTVKTELQEMKARHPESATGKLIGLFKGKTEGQKNENKAAIENKALLASAEGSKPELENHDKPLAETMASPTQSTVEKLLGFLKGQSGNLTPNAKPESRNITQPEDKMPSTTQSPSSLAPTVPSTEKS